MFACCFVRTRRTLWYVLEMKMYNLRDFDAIVRTTLICFNISEINSHHIEKEQVMHLP